MWTGVFGSGESDDDNGGNILCHGGDNSDYFGDAD